MPSFQNVLKGIKSEIREVDAAAVKALVDRPDSRTAVIDVRESDEYVQGYIPGARWISRGTVRSTFEGWGRSSRAAMEISAISPAPMAAEVSTAASGYSLTMSLTASVALVGIQPASSS